MTKSHSMRRTLTGAMVAAVGAALMIVAPAAQAAEQNTAPGTIGDLPDYEIRTGTLTIHDRLAKPPLGGPGTGLEQDVANPYGGITYKITLADDIDLRTNEGWQAAADLAASDDPTSSPLFVGGPNLEWEGTTGDDPADPSTFGTVTFDRISIGVWRVEAIAWPDGTVAPDPFIVTLPMRHPEPTADTGAWLYDVHAYPKGTSVSLTKSVTDESANVLGDPVDWQIMASIPAVTFDGSGTGYTITDPMDSANPAGSRLAWTTDDVTVLQQIGDGTPEPITGTALADEYGLTVTGDAATGLTVDFTNPAALPQPGTDGEHAYVVVEINTVVTGDPSGTVGDGRIGGAATLTVNGAYERDEAWTHWAAIAVTTTARGSGERLAGAAFQLQRSDGSVVAMPEVADGTWTTGQDGTVRIDGLRALNWVNGQPLTTPRAGGLQLVQIQAPDGYELLADPVPVALADVVATGGNVTDVAIENLPINGGFQLPMTGGTGTTIMTVIGASIVAAAVLHLGAARRRNAEA